MNKDRRREVLRLVREQFQLDWQGIHGVPHWARVRWNGLNMAADLRRLGVRSVRDLARRDPERLYARLCELTATKQDPCVLYTFRCAVYAARTGRPEPELLKWWNWKDRALRGRIET